MTIDATFNPGDRVHIAGKKGAFRVRAVSASGELVLLGRRRWGATIGKWVSTDRVRRADV